VDRFGPEVIENITYILLGCTALYFFWIAYKHAKLNRRSGVNVFLSYRGELAEKEEKELTADRLSSSLNASCFSLASAIFVYINWAAQDGVFALWSPLTWTLGAVVLFVFRKRIFKEGRKTWTIHSFLREKFRSVLVMKFASLITSIVCLLQVAAEVYVGLAVLQVLLGFEAPNLFHCLVIALVFVLYSAIGGLPCVWATDWLQYRITAFALVIATIFLFNNGGSTAIDTITKSFQTSFMPHGVMWVVFFSLLSLNLPIFITDMSVWQRIGIIRNYRDVTKGIGGFCFTLLFWMSLMVFLGAGFSTFFESSSGISHAQGMLNYFKDSLVFPILIVGFLVALLSTAGLTSLF